MDLYVYETTDSYGIPRPSRKEQEFRDSHMHLDQYVKGERLLAIASALMVGLPQTTPVTIARGWAPLALLSTVRPCPCALETGLRLKQPPLERASTSKVEAGVGHRPCFNSVAPGLSNYSNCGYKYHHIYI